MAGPLRPSPFLLLLLVAVPVASFLPLHPKVGEVKGYSKLKSWGNSSLYQLLTDSDYVTEPLLLHLTGSRYDMGYAYGYLLSEEISYAYHSLLDALIGRSALDEALIDVLGLALDWQWKDYMSKELPLEYVSELEGLEEGGKAAGCKECGMYSTRAIVLANFPSDLQDLVYIFLREVKGVAVAKRMLGERKGATTAEDNEHCSMFAVWGSRTMQSKLFSGRNLDWYCDTGVNKNKMIMVTVPDDGGFPSVSLGFIGLYGTLAGMSAKGLTVHEANLEENVESFVGFPWSLRLRYVMERASNIMEAKQLWEETNNTVGFNHMVASGPDAAKFAAGTSKGPVALAMETMYLYTAYFADDDPREANATYQPEQGPAVHIGFPMQEAVWRTNHGYDPTIRAHFMWSQAPSSWSMQRYMFIHDALVAYERDNVKIGYMQAINITAIAGDTGKDPYSCPTSRLPGNSHNVLSVTYQPEDSVVYVAWERNSGANWMPAACSTYIKLDLMPWFNATPPGP